MARESFGATSYSISLSPKPRQASLLKSHLHLDSQSLFRQRVEELGEDDLKAGENLNRQSAIRYLRKVSKHYLYDYAGD